jgi:hypothetical protein
MRRQSVRFMAIISLSVALFAAAAWLGAAQESTPQPGSTPISDDVTVESVGQVALKHNQRLEIFRITLGPGASIPLHEHPGTGILAVESGSISLGTAAGDSYLTGVFAGDETICGGGCKQLSILAPGSAIETTGEIPVGAATPVAGVVVLEAGDSVVETTSGEQPFNPVSHTYRAGSDGAVVLISTVLSDGEDQHDLPDACAPSPLSGRCTKHGTAAP